MGLFSLLAGIVLAAESVLSPIADDMPVSPVARQPSVTFGSLNSLPKTTASAVLGTSAVEASPAPSPKLTLTPSPTPITYPARKKAYTIAMLGDSMIDTLGPDVTNLKNKLSAYFPKTAFTILNFGVGGTNIDYGLERVSSGYTYLGKRFPSVASTQADIVVVESFAYNPYPYDAGALDRHWLQLAAIVDTLRRDIPSVKIIIAATIAPSSTLFGDGAPGLSFSREDKIRRTSNIKTYLDSTVKFALSQHLPLADVYHSSLSGSGDGIPEYINGGDHIHYSELGRELFAQKVADTIIADKLLE